jgi:B9 domain-containing protein 2
LPSFNILSANNSFISLDTISLHIFHVFHFLPFNLQGWGAPRISMQCFRLDVHGRRLLCGYGFAHLPTTPGFHRVEVSMWRPVGTPWQELEAFLIGRTPALSGQNGEPIYESAWRDRCRLVTVSAGKVFMELFVSARNLKEQGVDVNTYGSATAVTIKQQ